MLGAALVYFAQIVVDLGALNWVSSRRFDHFGPIVGSLCAFGLINLPLPHISAGLWVRLPLAVIVGLLFAVQSWVVLPPQLREVERKRLHRFTQLREG